MADKEFTVNLAGSADNLKLVEIDSADTIAEMVKKINDNFTNIAAHGGGPQGLRGEKGEDGQDGKTGKDGTGINLKASQADCTEIGDSYMAEDGHLWMFTGDGFKDLGVIKGEQGEKGEKGDKGDKGDTGPQGPKGDKGSAGTGTSVDKTLTSYAISNDGYNPPTTETNWHEYNYYTGNNSIDNYLGYYLWCRTTTKYTDGNSTTSYMVTYLGTNGKDGTNGKSVNIKGTLDSVAKLPKEGNVENDGYIVNGYLWIYTGTASDDYKSSDDEDSAQCHNGFENVGQFTGINGQSACMHVAWANSLAPDYDGFITYSAFSDNSGVKYKYRGIYIDYSDDPNTCKDPTDPSVYKWTDISGEKGEDAATVVVDLSEELVYVNLDEDGNTAADYSFTTTLSMFIDYGATEDPLTINAVGHTFGGTKLDSEGNPSFSVTVSKDTTATDPITTWNITIPKGVKATSFNVIFKTTGTNADATKTYTRNATFKVICIPAGTNGQDSVSYTLKPSVSTIYKYTSNGETSYSPATISCKAYKQIGGNVPEETTEGTIYYTIGSTRSTYDGTLTVNEIANIGTVESIYFEYIVGSKVWNYNTVYIYPGPGNLTLLSDKTEYYYATSLSPTATPTEWSETPMEGIAGSYIWTKIVYHWTDGVKETTSEIITYSRCGTGVDAIKAELNNESDYIMVGEDKILKLTEGETIKTDTEAYLYKGSDALELNESKTTFTIPDDYKNFITGTGKFSTDKKTYYLEFIIGSSVDADGKELVLSDKGCNIQITLVADDDNSTTRTTTYSLVWVPAGLDGVYYKIIPSANVIKYENDSFSDTGLTCSVLKFSANTEECSGMNDTTLKDEGLAFTYTIDGLDSTRTYDYSLSNQTSLTPVIGTITAADTTKFTKSVKFVLKYNDIVIDNETVYIIKDGENGAAGTNGKTLISTFKGVYSEDVSYTGTEDDKYIRVDIVYYQGEDESDGKYYMTNPSKDFTNKKGSDTGLPNATDSQYWMEFQGQYANIATGLLFTEQAIIENATIRSLKTADEGERIETVGNQLTAYDSDNIQRVMIDPESENSMSMLNPTHYNIPNEFVGNWGDMLISITSLSGIGRTNGKIKLTYDTSNTRAQLIHDATKIAIITGETYSNVYNTLSNGGGDISIYNGNTTENVILTIITEITGAYKFEDNSETDQSSGLTLTISGSDVENYSSSLTKYGNDIKVIENIALGADMTIIEKQKDADNIVDRYKYSGKPISILYLNNDLDNYATGVIINYSGVGTELRDALISLSLVFTNKDTNKEYEFQNFLNCELTDDMYSSSGTTNTSLSLFTTPYYSGQTLNSLIGQDVTPELVEGIYDISLRPYVYINSDDNQIESTETLTINLELDDYQRGIVLRVFEQGRNINIHTSGMSIVYNPLEYFQLGFKNISPQKDTTVTGLDLEMMTNDWLLKVNKLGCYLGNLDLYKKINFYVPNTGYGVVDISDYKDAPTSIAFSSSDVNKLAKIANHQPVYLQTWLGITPLHVVGDDKGYTLSSVLETISSITTSGTTTVSHYFLIERDGKFTYTSKSNKSTEIKIEDKTQTTYSYVVKNSGDIIYLNLNVASNSGNSVTSDVIAICEITFPKGGIISSFTFPTLGINFKDSSNVAQFNLTRSIQTLDGESKMSDSAIVITKSQSLSGNSFPNGKTVKSFEVKANETYVLCMQGTLLRKSSGPSITATTQVIATKGTYSYTYTS